MSTSNVMVAGMAGDGMGGLKESITKFRKHHEEVSAALLNISGVGTVTGGPVDKDEPRPAYVHQPWPKHTYHADGRDLIVLDADELKDAREHGYRLEPYPKPQVALGDPKAEKVAVQKALTQKDGEIAALTDLVQKMNARLEGVEKKKEKASERS